jgi:hypothetical protein
MTNDDHSFIAVSMACRSWESEGDPAYVLLGMQLDTEELDRSEQEAVVRYLKRSHVATERGRLESTSRCCELVVLKPD